MSMGRVRWMRTSGKLLVSFFFFSFFFSANKTITPSRPLCERIVLILELITDLYMGFAFEKM